jgi:hypothetical protein
MSFAADERASSTSQLASRANMRYGNRTDTGRQHPTPHMNIVSPTTHTAARERTGQPAWRRF